MSGEYVNINHPLYWLPSACDDIGYLFVLKCFDDERCSILTSGPWFCTRGSWCDCCLDHLPPMPGIWHHIWEVVTAPDPLSPKFAFPRISGHISSPLIGPLRATLSSDWLIVSSPHPPRNLRASIVSISVLTLGGTCRQSPGVQSWPLTNEERGRGGGQPMGARQCVQGTAQTLHSGAEEYRSMITFCLECKCFKHTEGHWHLTPLST